MVAVGYAMLGLLVGVLAGLSSSPVAAAVLASLFAFAGGSAAHLIGRKPSERRLVGVVITCFAGACLLGLLGGIALKVNRLLTVNKTAATSTATNSDPETVYLRTGFISKIDAIHVKYVNKDISAEEAYRELRAEIDNNATSTKQQ